VGKTREEREKMSESSGLLEETFSFSHFSARKKKNFPCAPLALALSIFPYTFASVFYCLPLTFAAAAFQFSKERRNFKFGLLFFRLFSVKLTFHDSRCVQKEKFFAKRREAKIYFISAEEKINFFLFLAKERKNHSLISYFPLLFFFVVLQLFLIIMRGGFH
jgi:hypothetical protein